MRRPQGAGLYEGRGAALSPALPRPLPGIGLVGPGGTGSTARRAAGARLRPLSVPGRAAGRGRAWRCSPGSRGPGSGGAERSPRSRCEEPVGGCHLPPVLRFPSGRGVGRLAEEPPGLRLCPR